MIIGYAFCGSFCTFADSIGQLEKLADGGNEIIPIMSERAFSTDTRFGKAAEINERIERICRNRIIRTIPDAEPLGPKIRLDLLIIAPCTGNTLAKIANGITDTSVTMAAKAHLRSDRPLLIAAASNDAMSANLSNIGQLMLRKNIYFVPLRQDDTVKKPHSLVADFGKIPDASAAALSGRQLRPLFI